MSNDKDGDTLLQEILQNDFDDTVERVNRAVAAPSVITSDDDPKTPAKQDKENHSQWALGGNGKYMPVGSTAKTLPAGIYEPFAIPGMWGLELMSVASDGIYILPDMATETVLSEVNKFWSSEQRYRDHKLLYKRGVILWGPPGGGKTVAVKLLMHELVKRDGVVVLAPNISLTIMCLKAIRRIEPKRNLIVVLEDIDEIINYNGEAQVLSMLDGENNVDNILHLATTNYPERLGARIMNRPSRFDRRVYVGMPEENARRAYLQKTTGGNIDAATLEDWVHDTKGMSVAHLRELVAAVYCLEQSYPDVIERLIKMALPEKDEDGYESKTMGFSKQVRQANLRGKAAIAADLGG